MSARIDVNIVLPLMDAASNEKVLEYTSRMVKLFKDVFEAGLEVKMTVNVRWSTT